MPCTSTRTLHGKESASTLKTSVSMKSIEVSVFVFITHAVELPVHYLPCSRSWNWIITDARVCKGG